MDHVLVTGHSLGTREGNIRFIKVSHSWTAYECIVALLAWEAAKRTGAVGSRSASCFVT